MKHIFKSIYIVFILAISFNSSAEVEFCKRSILPKIENYLNNNSKIAIPFKQISYRKREKNDIEGILLIDKPYKFRINYDPPYPLLITGSKRFLNIYDYELEELSRIDSKDNFFSFLLDLNVSLENSVEILDCSKTKNHAKLTIKHKISDQFAIVKFHLNPIYMKEVIIIENGRDLSGGYIKLIFEPAIMVSYIDPDLFVIKNPKLNGAPPSYDSKEIMQKLKLK